MAHPAQAERRASVLLKEAVQLAALIEQLAWASVANRGD